MKGYVKTRVSRFSDEWVLHFEVAEDRKKILEEDQDWLNMRFSNIRTWKEHDTNGRRKVWVSIYGIPLHAWCSKVFQRIGNKLGKTVDWEGHHGQGRSQKRKGIDRYTMS